jgi:hypothetical protein
VSATAGARSTAHATTVQPRRPVPCCSWHSRSRTRTRRRRRCSCDQLECGDRGGVLPRRPANLRSRAADHVAGHTKEPGANRMDNHPACARPARVRAKSRDTRRCGDRGHGPILSPRGTALASRRTGRSARTGTAAMARGDALPLSSLPSTFPRFKLEHDLTHMSPINFNGHSALLFRLVRMANNGAVTVQLAHDQIGLVPACAASPNARATTWRQCTPRCTRAHVRQKARVRNEVTGDRCQVL